jgi:hypothetical protein
MFYYIEVNLLAHYIQFLDEFIIGTNRSNINKKIDCSFGNEKKRMKYLEYNLPSNISMMSVIKLFLQ